VDLRRSEDRQVLYFEKFRIWLFKTSCALALRHLFMGVPYVFLARLSEVSSRHNVSKDTRIPLLTHALTVLQVEVFDNVSWRDLNHFDQFMLQNEHLAC